MDNIAGDLGVLTELLAEVFSITYLQHLLV